MNVFGYDDAMVGADCHYGDHEFRGGVCIGCGLKFRCACGQFMKVEDMEAHVDKCRWVIFHLESK